MQNPQTMQKYVKETVLIPRTDYEEEIRLAKDIALNNELSDVARDRFIKGNLGLVFKIANDFNGCGLPYLDLVSEGKFGLMRAVEKFDPSKSVRFGSYAAWWIKQAMRNALSNQSRTIRIPVNAISKISKIKHSRVKLEQKLGRRVSYEEIGGDTDLSLTTIRDLSRTAKRTLSLHDKISDDSEDEYQDGIIDESSNQQEIFEASEVYEILDCLKDEREKKVMIMKFGLDNGVPRSFKQVSSLMGYSVERTRQFWIRALEKMRKYVVSGKNYR